MNDINSNPEDFLSPFAVFKNKEKENQYRLSILSENKKVLLIVIIITGIANLFFIYIDYILFYFTNIFLTLLIVRLAATLFFIIIIIILSRTKNVFLYDLLSFFYTFFLSILLIYVNSTRPTGFIAYSLINIILILCLYLIVQQPLSIQWISPLFLSIISIINLQNILLPNLPSISISYLLVNLLGSIFSFRNHLSKRKHFSVLTREIFLKQKLQKSEAHLLRAQELGHFGYWELDLDSEIFSISDGVAGILGLNVNTFSLEEYKQLMSEDEFEKLSKKSDNAIESGVRTEYDQKIVNRHGIERWVHTIYDVEYDLNHKALRLVGTTIDITERKLSELELNKSKAFLEAVIHQSPIGIQICEGSSDNWKLTIINKEARRIIGITEKGHKEIGSYKGEIINPEEITWKMYYTDGKLWEPENVPISKAMSEEKITINEEMIIKREDGVECIILCNSIPIYNDKGSVIGAIVTYPDITEATIFAPIDSLLISLTLESGYLTRIKQTYLPEASLVCDERVIFRSISRTTPDATIEKQS